MSNTRRSDGERTHAEILETAMALASVEGLGSLSIGRLADALEMSKSGVYAHFGSKQRLQLETIEAARQVFLREVVRPGLAAPRGLGQLEALCEAFLSYVERGVFPGGCFFAAMLGEFDAQDGRLHDEVATDNRRWLEALLSVATEARTRGELRPDTDVDQLVFELHAALELGNYLYTLFRDPVVMHRARAALRNAIGLRRP